MDPFNHPLYNYRYKDLHSTMTVTKWDYPCGGVRCNNTEKQLTKRKLAESKIWTKNFLR